MVSESRPSFSQLFNIGLLVLAFFLILATSVFSIASNRSLAESIEALTHSRQVLGLITKTSRALGETESNGLRYLVTGNAEFQTTQRHAKASVRNLKQAIAKSVTTNALQRSYIAEFDQQFTAFLERSADIQKNVHSAVALGDAQLGVAIIRNNQNSTIYKDMFALLDNMTAEENRLIEVRQKERDELMTQSTVTVLVTNALAIFAGFLGFTALRSSQRNAEKALVLKLEQEHLRTVNKDRSSFLANMSHEIRTPMNAIFGFTQLLADSIQTPIERQWILSIKKSGQMLMSLINDVLDLSKMEAGMFSLRLLPTDIGAIVDETIDLFEPAADKKKIFLKKQIDHTINFPLLLDTQRVQQILINLIGNAVKYTEVGGIIVRVNLTENPTDSAYQLELSVEDTGVGIPEKDIERIFEPFHQADYVDNKLRSGTGLGLSITRKLVNAMAGSIQAISILGKGSSFIVKIPNVKTSNEPTATQDVDDRVEFNLIKPLKILLVDDVAWNNEVAAGYLKRSHHTLFMATNGREAVQTAISVKPDVILMDLRMPDMDGYDATSTLRSDETIGRFAIIAVSASTLSGEDFTLRQKFDGYIRKPYTPRELFNELRHVLGDTSQLQTAASEPDTSSVPSISTSVNPLNWSAEAQTRWLQIKTQEIPDLERNMRINHVSKFAADLHEFAQQARFAALENHALQLRKAVDNFEVGKISQLLTAVAKLPDTYEVTA